MGSDCHYPEEGPAHWVIVSPFWMDRYVTNAQFRKFVVATGHVTIAEIAPDPCDYPGALPDTLHPSSLVSVKPNQHCRSSTVLVCAAQLECPDKR
jgi:formylglycine-generating enzyme